MKKISFVVLICACGGADQSTLVSDSGAVDQSSPLDASQPQDAGADVTINPNDASQDAVSIVDVVTVDVPVKPPDSQIQCGNTTCSAQTQLCCYHVAAQPTFTCVSSPSDCQATDDVPINCSSNDNCASEGEPGFICCAQSGGPPNPSATCTNSTSAASVDCAATCTGTGEFVVGCSVQNQDCLVGTCADSVCSLPGYDICK